MPNYNATQFSHVFQYVNSPEVVKPATATEKKVDAKVEKSVAPKYDEPQPVEHNA